MGLLNMVEAVERCAALLVHAHHATQIGGNPRRTMVAALAPDKMLAVGLAHDFPIVADKAHNGVIAF